MPSVLASSQSRNFRSNLWRGRAGRCTEERIEQASDQCFYHSGLEIIANLNIDIAVKQDAEFFVLGSSSEDLKQTANING